MTRGLTVTKQIHFRSAKRGRKVIVEGAVADCAELARLAHVTRARMTQITNLLHLAPDIQEEILYLPQSRGGRDAVTERQLRPVDAIPGWRKQRGM